jgi:hypothetical protein
MKALVLAGAAAILIASCGAEPPVGPTVGPVRLAISGPSTLAPGQSATYTALEVLPDGNQRPVQGATWSSSDSRIIQITSTGEATALSMLGQANLLVTASQTGSLEVVVVPTGTYRVTGRVMDGVLPSTPVANARIDVTGGLSTTTLTDGSFRLFGVPREADVRVTGDGYDAFEQHLTLTSHSTHDFRLMPNLGGRPFDGEYTLVVEAGCSGPNVIPDDLRRRTYEASMRNDGGRLEVLLTESRFATAGNRFWGWIRPNGATFYIDNYYTPTPELKEVLPDGSMLIIEGLAVTTGSGDSLSGPLEGWFILITASNQFLANCRAGKFTLSRR